MRTNIIMDNKGIKVKLVDILDIKWYPGDKREGARRTKRNGNYCYMPNKTIYLLANTDINAFMRCRSIVQCSISGARCSKDACTIYFTA